MENPFDLINEQLQNLEAKMIKLEIVSVVKDDGMGHVFVSYPDEEPDEEGNKPMHDLINCKSPQMFPERGDKILVLRVDNKCYPITIYNNKKDRHQGYKCACRHTYDLKCKKTDLISAINYLDDKITALEKRVRV